MLHARALDHVGCVLFIVIFIRRRLPFSCCSTPLEKWLPGRTQEVTSKAPALMVCVVLVDPLAVHLDTVLVVGWSERVRRRGPDWTSVGFRMTTGDSQSEPQPGISSSMTADIVCT